MAGGFDVQFVSLPDRLRCPVCFVGMKDPLLTGCGHHFCNACVEPLRGDNDTFRCPVCRKELGPNQVFPDVAVEREVLNLAVWCDMDDEGCNWKGELRTLEDHSAKCQFVIVSCSLSCGASIMRQNMSKHVKAECCRRKVACKHCKNSFQFQNMKRHEAECPQMQLRCPQDCGKIMSRSKIERHVANDGTCLNTTLECPFEDAGCKFVGKRKDIAQHKKEEIENHLTMTSTKMNERKHIIADLKDEIASLKTETTDLKEKNAELKKGVCCWKEEGRPNYIILWKVVDWANNFDEAKNTEGHCIISSAVYITEPGHRVKITVYPNSMSGNVGIFLSLAEGKYDDLIDGRFRWDYSFTLIDQQKNGTNKTAILDGNEVAKKLKKSSSPYGYGFPKFISHDELEKSLFVKNDCLLVKIVVYGYY